MPQSSHAEYHHQFRRVSYKSCTSCPCHLTLPPLLWRSLRLRHHRRRIHSRVTPIHPTFTLPHQPPLRLIPPHTPDLHLVNPKPMYPHHTHPFPRSPFPRGPLNFPCTPLRPRLRTRTSHRAISADRATREAVPLACKFRANPTSR